MSFLSFQTCHFAPSFFLCVLCALCGKTGSFEARKDGSATSGWVKRNLARNRVNLFTIGLHNPARSENIRESFYFPFSVDQ